MATRRTLNGHKKQCFRVSWVADRRFSTASARFQCDSNFGRLDQSFPRTRAATCRKILQLSK